MTRRGKDQVNLVNIDNLHRKKPQIKQVRYSLLMCPPVSNNLLLQEPCDFLCDVLYKLCIILLWAGSRPSLALSAVLYVVPRLEQRLELKDDSRNPHRDTVAGADV